MSDKITLSVIKADVGGYVGHSAMHDDLLEEARRRLGLAAVATALAVFGAVVAVQPSWAFDVLARAAPHIVWRVETSEPWVALTFDDGPAPGHTSVVLDLLARHEARATFFMIGERAEAHPDLVEAVRERGHEIGNHAFADRRTVRLSGDELLTDLRRTDEETLWVLHNASSVPQLASHLLTTAGEGLAVGRYNAVDRLHSAISGAFELSSEGRISGLQLRLDPFETLILRLNAAD